MNLRNEEYFRRTFGFLAGCLKRNSLRNDNFREGQAHSLKIPHVAYKRSSSSPLQWPSLGYNQVRMCCQCNKPKTSKMCVPITKYKGRNRSTKFSMNKKFGRLLVPQKKLKVKKYHCKYRQRLKRFRFLLKIDGIDDKTRKLLENHQIGKESGNQFKSKKHQRFVDRRIAVIEHTLKCSIFFPGKLDKVRYKGITCAKVAIEADDNETIAKAINLLKTEIPLLYKDSIFYQKLNSEKFDLNMPAASRSFNLKQFVINRPREAKFSKHL